MTNSSNKFLMGNTVSMKKLKLYTIQDTEILLSFAHRFKGYCSTVLAINKIVCADVIAKGITLNAHLR